MNLYIPYGYTPYEEASNYGVFSTKEKAEEILEQEKIKNRYETYDIYVVQLDIPHTF